MRRSFKLLTIVDEAKITKWASELKSKKVFDTITLDPLMKFQCAFEIPKEKVINSKNEVHPASHWFYFAPYTPSSQLDIDGYESEFTPPGFVQRMFAGGEVLYKKPLKLKENYTRITQAPSVTVKNGKSGQLCFVQVKHEIQNESQEVCVTDIQNFVYRNSKLNLPPILDNPRKEFQGFVQRKETKLDEVLLFRFSSLTWNSHKIHYDKEYAKEEGYDHVLVHGPLSSTLLLDLIHSLGKNISRYNYQAIRPLFCNTKVNIIGKLENEEIKVWIEDQKDQNIKYIEAKATLN